MKCLSPPSELIEKFPISPLIENIRISSQEIVERKDPRLALLVGPCSIHDPASALEFAGRLKQLTPKVEKTLFPILRLFIEKPRTRLGWKGFLYDPDLDGSNDIEKGLISSRKLLTEIGSMGIGCSVEFLDPLVSFYIQDTVAWGVIGARTASSQPHRQMVSALPCPVGFKNDIHGRLEDAIDGIIASRHPHSHLGINPNGQIAALQSEGNPWTHLILRGSKTKTNYDLTSIAKAQSLLKKNGLHPRLMIDCSHGNSRKKAKNQILSFRSAIEQVAEGNRDIIGLMLESHLFGGKQHLSDHPSSLCYGISITDSCLSWEETEELLLWADRYLR